MNTKESLILINSFLYSFIVAFSTLDYIFLIPLLLVLFFEKEYIFKIFKKLILLNSFIVILVIFVYFQNPTHAWELLIRTNLILLFNITIFHKSKGYDIVRGLDALQFPSKIVSVFYFTLSLINYLILDFKETKNTLKARGFQNNTSMFTYQTYGNIFAMIFIKALKKSEDMQYSMNSRGFKDKIYFLNSDKKDIFEQAILGSIVIILIKVIYELFS
jgi:cobalt/nickel transport system permease protein